MIRNHLIVGLASVGVIGFSGLLSGCGHTDVAVAPPVVAPPPVVAEVVTPPPPPAPKLVATCEAEVRPKGRFFFPSEVEFDEGKSTLKMGSTTTTHILQCVLDFLNNNPMVTKFRIEGHTDNKGDAQLNMTLSQQRGEAVMSWLVGKGIATDRVWAKGFGASRPIAPNDTPEHMAQNRRVEFHVDGLNGSPATQEAIALALNPPAAVVTTTAVVAQPTVGVAVPTVGVAVPTVGVAAPAVGVAVPRAPTVGVGVAVPSVAVGVGVPTVGVGVGVAGAAGGTATAAPGKKDDKKDDKKKK